VLTDDIFAYEAFANRQITSISISPANSNEVLVTLGNYGNENYVYFTQDANTAQPTFTSKQSNLPKTPVYSGLIEMHGNNSAFIGTELGIFSTTDLNAANPSWGADIHNIGDVAVTEIRQQVMNDYHILNKGVIYIATYGRGIWMDTTYALPVGIEPIQTATAAHGVLYLNPNPVVDNVNIAYISEVTDNITAIVYDLTGRSVLTKNFGIQSKGTFNGHLNVSGLPKGTYLIKIGNAYGKMVKM
jgi:hypothetical protein